MKELKYPFDNNYILKKRKALKRYLLLQNNQCNMTNKKIAILGGSTTHDIKEILELFLLDYGILPQFYESEYNQFWEDAIFENSKLAEFEPDIIFIHTTSRNINEFPALSDDEAEINETNESIYQTYVTMWEKLRDTYHCPIIQNNFEPPYYRLLGNKDVSDIHGRVNFINNLNQRFYEYAQTHNNFYINDINYLAACYGLLKWLDPFYWHMYKYALAVPAIPELAFNIANIIKSIYGKNKKALVLDLDNTLWGGIIGEDGSDYIEIGQETPTGQIYREFQQYIKSHKELGVMLNIDSKNDYENAIAGLNRPESILKPEDFINIKANWDSKDKNLIDIAQKLNIGTDSIVFVDDNPAERCIVELQIPEVAVPELLSPETYITVIDRSGYFEVTSFSQDDLKRNEMYQANARRHQQQLCFTDYKDYLLSLEMKAEIEPFCDMYLPRIVQLINKSNQFNLTTKRCSQSDMETIVVNSDYITLYGKLEDKFGDNGVVSVVMGCCQGNELHIELWLMSCRVLKRDMEFAMMDSLAKECLFRKINTIKGYYYPTTKNKMVKDFYALMGFKKIEEDADGNTIWELDLSQGYKNKNKVIEVEE